MWTEEELEAMRIFDAMVDDEDVPEEELKAADARDEEMLLHRAYTPQQRYYARNLPYFRAKAKRYSENNKSKINARRRAYRREHPELVHHQELKQRERRKARNGDDAKKLRDWMGERGMLSAQLAELCGVSKNTVHRWRSGTRRIPDGVRQQLGWSK